MFPFQFCGQSVPVAVDPPVLSVRGSGLPLTGRDRLIKQRDGIGQQEIIVIQEDDILLCCPFYQRIPCSRQSLIFLIKA